MKKIQKSSINNAEQLMCDAAERLTNLVSSEEEDCVVEINGQKTTKVAVSMDGTWQKRGHSSKIGVVFAVSVRIGEVLDYEVKSLILSHDQKAEIPGDSTALAQVIAQFALNV